MKAKQTIIGYLTRSAGEHNLEYIMPKKRTQKDPYITYVHPSTGKLLLKQGVLKFGSLRQLALRLDMSVAHAYRLANNDCRMKITWYKDIQKLLEQ